MASVLLSRSVTINAPPATVFAAMTDWPRQNEWMVGTIVKAGLHGGQGVSGTIAARTALGPFGFTDPMTITDWQPPHRCAVTHTGRIVCGSGVFLVEPIGDESTHQTRFTWSETVQLPFGWLGRLGWMVAQPAVGLGLNWSLRRFKRWVE